MKVEVGDIIFTCDKNSRYSWKLSLVCSEPEPDGYGPWQEIIVLDSSCKMEIGQRYVWYYQGIHKIVIL